MNLAVTRPTDAEHEIESVIQWLAGERGDSLAQAIRPIIYINQARRRIANYLDHNPDNTLKDYASRVANHYEEQRDYVYQIQHDKSISLWEPLYGKLQAWAYGYLVRCGFPRDKSTFQRAVDCAADAGAKIVSSHFPFDTQFDAWSCVIVHHVCKKHIALSKRKLQNENEQLVDLGEQLGNWPDLRQKDVEYVTQIRHDLLDAIRQLSPTRQQVILRHYVDGYGFEEIADELDKSMTAVYQLHFKARGQIGKILAAKGYNL